jgi:hypothetical protein
VVDGKANIWSLPPYFLFVSETRSQPRFVLRNLRLLSLYKFYFLGRIMDVVERTNFETAQKYSKEAKGKH